MKYYLSVEKSKKWYEFWKKRFEHTLVGELTPQIVNTKIEEGSLVADVEVDTKEFKKNIKKCIDNIKKDLLP